MKHWRKIFFVAALIFVLLCVAYDISHAGEIVLSWEPPTKNEDDTPLTDLAGYKVYYGTESGNYSHNTNVGNVTTYQVIGLTVGVTYYFSVTAYDTSGNESAYADEKFILIAVPDITAPDKPTAITCIQSNIIINNQTWIGVQGPPDCSGQ